METAQLGGPWTRPNLERSAEARIVVTTAGIRCQGVRRPEGFHRRFGLVHVDFETQRCTPKASYAWYCELIASHRKRHGR
ncbi:family 1 glycosylhydrolase [Kitasatospora sp. NPDC056138]|uniref:family 1 glycosylhydrolase n=1 Tax=Kitasatospora sp. NPDC056138 TaxID=3345724 RepID=UPI0035E01B6E